MAITSDIKQQVDTRIITLAPPRETAEAVIPDHHRALRRLRRHRMAMVGLGILVFVVLYVVIGSFLIPEASSNYNDPGRALHPPSSDFIFGTDDIGRDINARIIYGGQVSLFIAVTAVTVAIGVGTLIGLISGYFGSILDAAFM